MAPPLDEQATVPAWTDEPLVDETLIAPPLPPEPPLAPLPPDPPDGRDLDRALAIGLVVLLLLVALGVGAAYLLTRGDGNDKATNTRSTAAANTVPAGGTLPVTRAIVVAPSVVGASRRAAVARLRARGLHPTARNRASDRPAGTVLDQQPAAGSKVPRGSSVLLVVSSGPAVAAVPTVTGLSVAAAKAKLTAAGLDPRTRKQPSAQRAGTVLSQSPAAGTKLDRGAPVVLVVATPQPKVAVPDLVGQSRIAAKLQLRKAGLVPRVHLVPSAQKAGTVVAQHPRAGTLVARGSLIRFNVARAATTTGGGTTPPPGTTPATTTPTTTTSTTANEADVPDVTSLDEQEATTELQNAGFEVATTDQDTTEESEDGLVLDQTPGGGEQARAGSTVTITVGRFSG